MPLLGAAAGAAAEGEGAALRTAAAGNPAGLPAAGSQEDVQSGSSGSLRSRSRQGTLLDLTGWVRRRPLLLARRHSLHGTPAARCSLLHGLLAWSQGPLYVW